MTSLCHSKDLSLEFGDQTILKDAEFSIEAGERVCLIGRNGAGKSTLINIIAGSLEPDVGKVHYKPHLRISRLQQALPSNLDESVYDYVKSGLAHLQQLIDDYHERLQNKTRNLHELQSLQQQIEASGGWNIDHQVERILSNMNLPDDKVLRELSGGWQRRAELGRALVSQPELLLLDEPTNHLDLSAIQWLEDKVNSFDGSILFVTHDRAFMQRLSTRILELDRGRLRSWSGSYHKYLADKEQSLEEEARRNALFDKKLEQEEAWIREGIKARRTRNEGRVRALMTMREEYSRRARPQDQVRIHIEEGELSGRKVMELHKIVFGYGEEQVINGLSLKIQRGDRIGLIGNNGVGKSTLIRIILGELKPSSGTVKSGSNLQIACFDQLRKHLDPEKTVAEIIGEGSDYVKVNGRDRHVIGYLKGFLFSPKRSMTRVSVLSGGECNRILLAKLFTRPSNLLILDEPTNDLDVETLEVLEERLTEYTGTLIVVSHDREFLDNVVTSTLVFEDGGTIRPYPGGYSDWLKQGKWLKEDIAEKRPGLQSKDRGDAAKRKSTKLSYKLQRELDGMPDRIETLESELQILQQTTSDTSFYQRPQDKVKVTLAELAEKEALLSELIQRWAELESLQQGLTQDKNTVS
jgi:ATP-binding cassette subfamily F protein uup